MRLALTIILIDVLVWLLVYGRMNRGRPFMWFKDVEQNISVIGANVVCIGINVLMFAVRVVMRYGV